jgi:ketosteroid isomerase-like protein
MEMELAKVGRRQAFEGLTVSPSREIHELGLGSLGDARCRAVHGESVATLGCDVTDESGVRPWSVSVEERSEEVALHPNEHIVRRLFSAFETNDTMTIDALLADDVVWNAPGRGVHSGRRIGKQELFAGMGRLAELTGGTLRGEVHDVLASDDHVVVLQTTRGERDGHASLEDREALILHVRDGKVAEVWEHPGDVYAMDAFFS